MWKSCCHDGIWNDSVTAVDGDRTVGMARLTGDGMYGLIVDVAVMPQYQGKGIGSRMVDMVLEYAGSQTPMGGRCGVQLAAAKGKEGSYEKKGFKGLPGEFTGSGMRRVIYK